MYWYLYRDRKKWAIKSTIDGKEKIIYHLIYNWNNLSDVVDVQETVHTEWIKDIETFQIKIIVYWKERIIALPRIDDENIERNSPKPFYDNLLELTRDWLITDETRWVRQEVIKFVNFVLIKNSIYFSYANA